MRVRGFSLLELILTMLLIGILAMVSLPMLVSGFSAFSQQQETVAVEREAMLALERVAREIRMGRNFTVSGSSINFDRYDNAGNDINVTLESQGSELVVVQGGTTSTLARNVGSLSFSAEAHEGACYINTVFSTAGISEPWRVVTYTRNASC